MALWLVRCGKHGEFESRFLQDGRIYLTWDELAADLGDVGTREEVRAILKEVYPSASQAKLSNHTGQIFAFLQRMQPGDWIAVPSKHKPAIHVGEITGTYEFCGTEDLEFRHSRRVKWIETDVPRSNFGQDLLYSLGAIMTICQVQKNDAEARVRAMPANGWRDPRDGLAPSFESEGDGEVDAPTDLEEIARDAIAKRIVAHYKGHGMALLVDAILRAQGYTTHLSPPGPDKGVDLLAARGDLGFDDPRICVQVKSGDSPLDRPTLDQLVGTMQNFRAARGLLVSWGGFKSSVDKERAGQFFRVRLWDRDDLIEQLLAHYDRLDDEIRADLPLKRIWTVSTGEASDATS